MSDREEKPRITNNEKASRFELVAGGHVAFAAYELRPDVIVLLHTEVPKELSGRALCPFMAKYIEKHPEHQDLVRS